MLNSQGFHDWSVVQLAAADGKTLSQRSFGGAAEDGIFGLTFDNGDLVLFGDGSGFGIGNLSVPSAKGQSTSLVLAKMDKSSTSTGFRRPPRR